MQKSGKQRWQVPVPKVDFRKWWYGYLGHGLEGAIAAVTMVVGPFLWPGIGAYLFGTGALLFGGSIIAQWLGFLRKNDTPGRDVHHIIIGFILGLLASGIVLEVW